MPLTPDDYSSAPDRTAPQVRQTLHRARVSPSYGREPSRIGESTGSDDEQRTLIIDATLARLRGLVPKQL
jgi:hypothetical protein